MAKPRTVYICPECHWVSLRAVRHHNRKMVKCDAGVPGDPRSKPLFDAAGNLKSRAPRWWIEACAAQETKRRVPSKSRLKP